jgi:hypothetical protein
MSEQAVTWAPDRLTAQTCGWLVCEKKFECAALLAFMAEWNAGRVRAREPVTSEWWESAEADEFYRRGVQLERRD